MLLMLLAACFAIVLMFEKSLQQATKLVPDVQCNDGIEELAAFLDHSNPTSKRNGEFHCFCLDMLNTNGYSYVMDYRFTLAPEDEAGDLCYDWLVNYGMITSITMGIPGVVCLVNILTEVFVGFASMYRRPITQTRNVIDSIFGVTLI